MHPGVRPLVALLGSLMVSASLFAQGAVRLEPVAEGVWAVRRAYAGSNAAVIVGSEGLVVIDSHVTPAAAADTLAAIREISDAPIRFVVDTHWHTDHSVGAASYLDAYPDAEVIAHHTVREDLTNFGPEQMEISVTSIRGRESTRINRNGDITVRASSAYTFRPEEQEVRRALRITVSERLVGVLQQQQ